MAYPYYPQPIPQLPQLQQPMAQPSRAVEVYQVESEQAVTLFPVGNGSTQMLLDRNDAFIAVKSVALDGTVNVTYYDKRPPAPVAAPFNPAEYVRRDEIAEIVAAAINGKKKKEAAE